MSWIKEWYRKSLDITKNPEKFFEKLSSADNLAYPAKFIVTSGLYTGLIVSILNLLLLLTTNASIYQFKLGVAPTTALTFLLTAFLVILAVLVRSFFIHIVVAIFGKRGFKKTFEALSYPTGIFAILVWTIFIPILSIIVGIWVLYAELISIKKFHGISSSKAFIALVLSYIALIILIVISLIPFMVF